MSSQGSFSCRLDGTTKDENEVIPPLKGTCERIQFLLPSLVRRGLGGGRKSRWTNPLESPLAKGDTCEVAPKPIFSQLQGRSGTSWRTPERHPQSAFGASPLKGGFSEALNSRSTWMAGRL